MRNAILTTLLAVLCSSGIVWSQEPASKNEYINIQVTGLSNTDVYLANYYGNRLYYADTARADAQGNFSFKGRPFNEQGKYAVVIPDKPYFDIIVGDENISLKTDTAELVGNLEIIESENNRVFYDYVRFINEMRVKREPHDMVMADSLASEGSKEKATKALIELNDQVVERQQQIVDKHGDLLFGKYVHMMMDVQIPEEIGKGESDADKKVARYEWYKSHYWDHVDLKDNRMVRDQGFHNALERYVQKVIPQFPDSVIAEAKRLIDRVEGNDDLFKYIVHHVTYYSETSKLMCMDKVFVWMVDNYYTSGKANWMEPEKLAKIIEAAESKRYSLCDETFPNIILKDTTGQWVSVLDIDAQFTIVTVWESTCGHCKKEMPVLADVAAAWADKGVRVYAIGNDYEREPWMKFIREKGLDAFINVSDDPSISNDNPQEVHRVLQCCTNLESLNYRSTLDIQSTPKIWLLDADKKIIAKQMAADQLGDILQSLFDEANADGDQAKPKEATPAPKASGKKGKRKKDSDAKG